MFSAMLTDDVDKASCLVLINECGASLFPLQDDQNSVCSRTVAFTFANDGLRSGLSTADQLQTKKLGKWRRNKVEERCYNLRE